MNTIANPRRTAALASRSASTHRDDGDLYFASFFDRGNETIEDPGDELFTFTSVSDNEAETASFDGGTGNDTLDATFGANGSATGGLTTSFTDNGDGTFSATYTRSNSGTEGDDSVSIVNIENVFISVIGDSNGVGNGDYVQTGDGDDHVFTDNGADTIVAGKGVDTVDGGTSDEFGERDVISKDFSDLDLDIAWNIQTGVFSGPGSFTNLEAFGTLLTGSGNDTIVTSTFSGASGTPGAESISTGAGNDQVSFFNGIGDNADLGSGSDRLILDYRNSSFTGNTTMTLTETSPGTYSGSFDSSQSGGPDATFQGVEHFTIMTLNSGGNGSNLADTIVTGNGNDIIFTGASSDSIYVAFGIDQVDGGETGTDIDGLSKNFGAGAPAINIDLLANTYSGPGSYTNLEYFIDLKTGNADDVVVTTGADSSGRGNDVIDTKGGNDTVTLFDGTDTVDLGSGTDRLILDFGSSAITSFLGNTAMTLTGDLASGYTGSWDSSFSGGADVTFAGVEHFTIRTLISGGNGSNLVDNIVTGDGNDDVFTGGSSDNIDVGGGQDTVDGGSTGTNNDGLAKEFGFAAPDIIFNLLENKFFGPGSYTNIEYFIDLRTGIGDDVIDTASISSSGRGNDVIFTRGGDDKVTVRHGNDTVDMGGGHDLLVIDYATITVFTSDTVLAITETSPGSYSGQWSTGASTNGVIFSGVEQFMLRTAVSGGNGFNLKDNITTGAGDDVIFTYASADTVHAGAGDDFVDGGVYHDALYGEAGDDRLLGGTGNDVIDGGADDDVLKGDDGADTLSGGDGDDKLDGGAGIDTVDGGAGVDRLVDKEGGDLLRGGEGDDVYTLLFGSSTIVEEAGGGDDKVRVADNFTLSDNVEQLVLLSGSGGLTGTGNDQDNTISAFGGDDTLDGMGGKDFLSGGGGNDLMSGSNGNDTVNGGGGSDVLRGNGGDDRLIGDKGFDTMTGGSGEDTFLFRDDSQFDTITDFEDGSDRIHLVDYREENGGDKLTLDQLLITQIGSGTTRIELDLDRNGIADVIDLDGDGTGDAWHVDLLDTNANALTAADFVL